MSRFLMQGVAALALAAMVGLPAISQAQDAAPAETPAPAAEAEALPQVLQDLDLTEVQVRQIKRGEGRILRGTLPDGGQMGAFVDDSGELRGAFLRGDGALPETVADALLPQPVRDQDVFGQLASVSAIFVREGMVMVGGTDADGEKVRAGFSPDGTLMRFGRGEGAEHRAGPHGRPGDRHWHDRGPRDRDRGHHERRQGKRPAISDEAVQGALDGAGYTDIGQITREGPRVSVEATNPEGEPVRVEVNPRGEVMRETAR